jgi:hypothetical protein
MASATVTILKEDIEASHQRRPMAPEGLISIIL